MARSAEGCPKKREVKEPGIGGCISGEKRESLGKHKKPEKMKVKANAQRSSVIKEHAGRREEECSGQ